MQHLTIPATLPPHLQALFAGKLRAIPLRTDDVALTPAREVPASSPLKTRTVRAVVEDMGELEVHDSPIVYADEDGEVKGMCSVDLTD